MSEHQGREDTFKTLCRMLAYVRDEAVRLSIPDVALLLEHAEGAVTAFAPCVLPDLGRRLRAEDGGRVEH